MIGAVLNVEFLAYECLLLKMLNKGHLLKSEMQSLCSWAGPGSQLEGGRSVPGPAHSSAASQPSPPGPSLVPGAMVASTGDASHEMLPFPCVTLSAAFEVCSVVRRGPGV